MRTGLTLSFNNSCPLSLLHSLSVFTEDEEVYGWKERKRCDSSCWLVSLCKLLCLSWRMSKINEKHLQGKEKLKDEKHFHCLLLLYPQVFSYLLSLVRLSHLNSLWLTCFSSKQLSSTSFLFFFFLHLFLSNCCGRSSFPSEEESRLTPSVTLLLGWKLVRMRSKEAFLPVFLLRDPCISFTTGCSLWINLKKREKVSLEKTYETQESHLRSSFSWRRQRMKSCRKEKLTWDTVSFWLMIDFSLWFLPF